MCHSMKIWEQLKEAGQQIPSIGNTQYDLRPGKSTTEPIFILQILQEKCREMNKELHMVFVDLVKAYNRVHRELIWWCLRKKGVPEGYVTIILDIYNDCETPVSTRIWDTEYFQVTVGLHQESALSPLLFILIIDVLQAEIGKEPPWVMLFADDLVICEHSRAEVELQLERWRDTVESHGLRVSRGKTEYMPCPERDQTIYNQEKELNTMKMINYLGSMFDGNGGAEKDVNNRVKIAWSKWRNLLG